MSTKFYDAPPTPGNFVLSVLVQVASKELLEPHADYLTASPRIALDMLIYHIVSYICKVRILLVEGLARYGLGVSHCGLMWCH